jgi:hypothetical protein
MRFRVARAKPKGLALGIVWLSTIIQTTSSPSIMVLSPLNPVRERRRTQGKSSSCSNEEAGGRGRVALVSIVLYNERKMAYISK